MLQAYFGRLVATQHVPLHCAPRQRRLETDFTCGTAIKPREHIDHPRAGGRSLMRINGDCASS
jgi:hypothetical protein